MKPELSSPVISFASVHHRYRKVAALRDVSLVIPLGGMRGLIGPDGVGKSTFLALAAGVKRVQAGSIEVLGSSMREPSHRRACLQRIAYMPQGLGRNLYPTLSVFENLDYFGRLFGQGADERRMRIEDLLTSTGLEAFLDRPAGKLSGGMKQKLSLCSALIHDPDLLILDEPTTGVDPLSRRQFWELIERIRLRRPQMTVVAATAYMEEANRFDWLAAMDDGAVIAVGTPQQIKEQAGVASLEEAFIRLLPEERRKGHTAVRIPPRSALAGPPAIEATGLTKRLGTFAAVDNVSFRIERGEIFGFLGSNGCGKSTTMRMLTGLLPATSGEASVLGRPVTGDDMAIRRRVGYMSQSFSLYRELTVLQNLELHAAIFELPPSARGPRVAELLDRFGLKDDAESYPESLPLGLRQRLQLAVAVLHRPEILILDEPTSGVDPIARDTFWQYLSELSRDDGVTVFLSTHFMNEAERCDRISLMHAGKVLAVGTPAELVAARKATDLDAAFVGYLEDAVGGRGKSAGSSTETDSSPAQVAETEQRISALFDIRRLWACARRESLEVLRDPIRMAFAMLGPIILLMAFGFGISFDVDRLPFAEYDFDRSYESRELLANFEGSRYFDRRPDIAGETEMEERLARGDVSLVVEVPAGFGRDLQTGRPVEVAVWIDGAMPFRAETIRSYVTGLSSRWQSQHAALHGELPAAEIGVRFRYNQTFRSPVATVPGIIMLMLMLIPAIMSALTVVRERETGSIANFRSTPVTKLEFLAGKQLPYIVLSLAGFAMLLLLARLIFGVSVTGSAAALAVGAFIYVMATTAFGLLISTVTRTQLAAIVATPIIAIVPAMNFSGMLTPVSSLTPFTRLVGLSFPAAWFQYISVGTFSKALGFADLWPMHVVLAGFAVAYLSLASLLLPKQES